MSTTAPTAEERRDLLALLDAVRERGAVRMAYGLLSVDFAGPKADPSEKPQLPTEPLNRAERDRLAVLEERYQFDEELGNG